MKILRVSKQPLTELQISTLAEYGVMMSHSSPTLLSAVTALRIAKSVERHDIDIVVVSEQPDAVAAVSARKISSNPHFKIIYAAAPDTDCPRTLHREVIAGVDGWQFVSERQSQTYPAGLKNMTVIEPVSFDTAVAPPQPSDEMPKTVGWIGNITNPERLKTTVEIIDSLDSDVSLRICGAGNARDVMPVVRYTRVITHPHRVTWVGEEYDKAAEIARCDCAVRTARDLTDTETLVMMSGRPVIEPEDLPEALARTIPIIQRPSLHDYIHRLRQYYNDIINEASKK